MKFHLGVPYETPLWYFIKFYIRELPWEAPLGCFNASFHGALQSFVEEIS